MDWMSVTVLTTTDGADIVSEALMRAGSAGTVIEDKRDILDDNRPESAWDIIGEELAARMSDDVKVTGYYPLDERAPDALAYVRERITALKSLSPDIDFGKLDINVITVDEEDWAQYWKREYKPFRLGKHMVVKPAWEAYHALPDDKLIVIDPGMAFGTGTHETTGMCVSLIEEYVKSGMTVYDIGTGTGILAIAAALAGARRVLALDIDPMAVRVARENVEKNGWQSVIDVRQGDLLADIHVCADIIVANIISDLIISIAQPVRALINSGGAFICSGIAREREHEAIAALKQAGYGALDIRRAGEWTAIACARD